MRRHVIEAPADLSALLEHWVEGGFITREQAERIRSEPTRAVLRPTPAPAPALAAAERTSLVTEALGYLGGVLILVAAGLITARFWEDMALGVRLGLVAAAAMLLLGAGAAIPDRLGGAGYRLRAVLWLLSAIATGTFLGLLAADGLNWQGEDVLLLAGGGTALYGGILWWRHRSILQQLAVFVALAVSASAATAHLPSDEEALPGLSVWGVAVIWFALGWGGFVTPRRAAFVLGGIGALFGAAITMTADWGLALGLATAAALVGVAVLFGDLVLLAVGAIGALQILPSAVSRWFPGALAAPLALLAVGVVLVAAAVYTARRRSGRVLGPSRDRSSGSPRVALAVAGGVALAVTVTAVILGLT
jgi:hypothetical protein